MIAVGITTFNREKIVGRAIASALSFIAPLGGRVVLVDDASTDETGVRIAAQFAQDIASGRLLLVRHNTNLGVSEAKNTAFERAGDARWVLFLDSDDELIAESAQAVSQVLDAHRDKPVVFFRCVDENGAFVGRMFPKEQSLSVARFTAHTSYGEALVAMNKGLSNAPPFDGDLRGYEGLGCARRISQFGPAVLSPIVARRYNRSSQDRLSRPMGLLARATLLARGHLRYVAIAGYAISWRQRLGLWTKAVIYYTAGVIYFLIASCLNRFRSRS